MELLRVALSVAPERAAALHGFYAGLGLERGADGRYAIGSTELAFERGDGEPFYHFAVLVPGDRFAPALAWARERVDLLPGGGADDVVFDFEAWDARACYFHDPAGNIVELIAHRGIGESGATGPFDASELLGLSELGLVGPPETMAHDLDRLGVVLWDGVLDEPGRLAFLGERGRTLILCPSGRGWLPTGRPAEPHPVDVVLAGGQGGAVMTTAGHTIRCVPERPPSSVR